MKYSKSTDLVEIEHQENKPRKKKCNGKKSDGRACGNWAAKGSDKCAQRHNGKASTNKTGANNPNYKGKGWSNYLPERLHERLLEAWHYSELFTNREDIAFLRMRQSKLAERLDSGRDPLNDWIKFKKLNKEKDDLILQLISATSNEDKKAIQSIKAKFSDLIGEMNGVIKSACDDVKINQEIRSIINQVSGLITKQHEIEVRNKQYVKVEQMALLINALMSGIDVNLPNQNVMVNSIEIRRRLMSHICFTFNLPRPNENGYRLRKEMPPTELEQNYKEVEKDVSE